MKGKSLKWLRILHIISAGIWFGATVCIGGLAVICLSNPDAAEFLVTAPLVPELYRKMILPAALFTILQGLVYGFFTEWGFLKHRWVTIKWIFTILLIPCIGAGGIGQMFALIDKVKSSGLNGGLHDGGLVLLFISLQILIMLIMIGISVYKPWKKKSAVKQQIFWLTDKPPVEIGYDSSDSLNTIR